MWFLSGKYDNVAPLMFVHVCVCDGDPSSQYTRKLLADSLLAYYALKTVESTNLVKTKNLDLFKIIVIIIKGTYVRIIVKFDCYSYLNILSVGMLSSCFIWNFDLMQLVHQVYYVPN